MLKHKTGAAYAANYEAMADILRENGVLTLNRGAEIGVRHGEFSEYLLQQFPDLELRCVDPYEPYQDLDIAYTHAMQEAIFRGALRKLEPFCPRVVWYFERSTIAAHHIPAGTLDFAFIDAEHTFKCAFDDLIAWERTVRPDGLLCGHDYGIDDVRRAVDHFAALRGLEVSATGHPADVWMIQMPRANE